LGTLERGAIWPSLNQTLVWALAGMDKEMAWDEWKRNTLAKHADAYPNLWYGVWSGNDSYNSTLNRNPGGAANEQYFAGTDFPVLNLHAHACYLYSATKLLGIEFTEAGVKLRPALPVGAYRFDSPLLGLVKTAAGRYEGWYAPSRAGSWTLEIALPRGGCEDLARGGEWDAGCSKEVGWRDDCAEGDEFRGRSTAVVVGVDPFAHDGAES
jgi:hypothetical protein